jgi:hypothetical protein
MLQTDTNEHVKETSAQKADTIIPEVLQTDTNEHVKETSAQKADTIIPEVLPFWADVSFTCSFVSV